jgi:hypothetical protein
VHLDVDASRIEPDEGMRDRAREHGSTLDAPA